MIQECERCEQMLDELAQINSLLDRLHGRVYDFHNISAIDAVCLLVTGCEVWLALVAIKLQDSEN